MRSRLGLLLLCFILIISGIGLQTAAASTGSGSGIVVAETHDIDADEITIDIAIENDGTATWTISYWVELSDDETADAFDAFSEDLENDPDGVTETFADRIDATVATASEATDREMRATDYGIETDRQSLAREYGIVRYSFTWDGFAVADGDSITAGDAIDGLYLDDGTRLVLQWPEEYERTDVTPAPDDTRSNAVVWTGTETSFVSGEPRLVVEPTSMLSHSHLIAGALLILAGGIGGIGLWLRRQDGGTPADSTIANHTDSNTEETTLLSNEEQVIGLLDEYGGRMKQQRIVSELDWTDAKTSKVISRLREDGRIESFRLGRENVVRITDPETDSLDEPA